MAHAPPGGGALSGRAAALAALTALASSAAAQPPEHDVRIVEYEHRDEATSTPVTVERAGAAVAWLLEPGLHTVTEGAGAGQSLVLRGFESGLRNPRASFRVTFREPGAHASSCAAHDAMRGLLTVTPA